jgi:hypothetical protein
MDPSRRLVLVTIADHSNERDGCLSWASNATLSKRTGICERQVQEHRVALEASGLIELVSNTRGGRGKAKVYRLKVEKMLVNLAASDPKKAAAHCRDLRRIPGALPLGFVLQNPAASTLNPAASTPKPSSGAHERERPTATEPEVEPESKPESEPARAREARNAADIAIAGQQLLKKVSKGEPEAVLSRDEQSALSKVSLEVAQAYRARKLAGHG